LRLGRTLLIASGLFCASAAIRRCEAVEEQEAALPRRVIGFLDLDEILYRV
jgi:hypothetical protein